MSSSDVIENSEPIEVAFETVADEFVASLRRGEDPSVEEYAERSPQYAPQLRELLPTLKLIEMAKRPKDADLSNSSMEPPSIVATRVGDFDIVREIGRGGMGVVYEARQVSLGRQVALKVLSDVGGPGSSRKTRFEREARAAARLHHTNIVPVFGVGDDNGLSYYVMQYIHGLGLDDVIEKLREMKRAEPEKHSRLKTKSIHSDDGNGVETNRPKRSTGTAEDPIMSVLEHSELPSSSGEIEDALTASSQISSTSGDPYWRNIASIGLQVSDALQYAHEQGVIHRDIKPSNLLLDNRRTVWVTDFGLANVEDEADITRSGDLLGTIRYMPPEAFETGCDQRSDLYSLGITLYEMVTLEPAFSASGRRALIKKVSTECPDPVSTLAPDTPRDLATIIEKTIERNPNHRYQSASELHEDLRRFLNDQPILARRVSTLERFGRWSRQNRPLAASLLGLFILLVVIAVSGLSAAIYFSDQQRVQRDLYLRADAMATQNEQLLMQSVESKRQLETSIDAEKSQAELTRRSLYSANMLNAFEALDGHRGYSRTQLLLDRWRPGEDEVDLRSWEWYYIQARCRQYQFAIPAHDGPIHGISISPGGEFCISVGQDKTAAIWDLQSEVEVVRMASPVGKLRCVAWDPLNRFIVAGGDQGMVVWDCKTWNVLHIKRNLRVNGLQWRNDGSLLARSALRVVRNEKTGTKNISEMVLLEPKEFDVEAKFPAGQFNPSGIQMSFSPDGSQFAYPFVRWIRIWNLENHTRGAVMPPHGAPLSTTLFHPVDASIVLSGGTEGFSRLDHIKEMDQESSTPADAVQKHYFGHTHAISQIAWHPDGEKFATASWDGSIRIWDRTTHEQLHFINGHDRHVNTLAYTPDGNRLLSAGYDGMIRCWQPGINPAEKTSISRRQLSDCRFSPDNSLVASANTRGELRLFDTSSGDLLRETTVEGRSIQSIAFAPDGSKIVGVGKSHRDQTGWIAIWETESLQILHEFIFNSGAPIVDWSANDETIAIVSGDDAIQLFDRHLTQVSDPIKTQFRSISDLQFGADSQSLMFGGSGGIGVLDIDSQTVRYWDKMPHANTELEWSRSGKKLAIATNSQKIEIWDVATRTKQIEFENHFEPIYAMRWSPDGRRLLSVDARGTLALWDDVTGQATLKFQTGYGPVRTADWSRDGKMIVSNNDREIIILDAGRGFEIERERQE